MMKKSFKLNHQMAEVFVLFIRSHFGQSQPCGECVYQVAPDWQLEVDILS